MDNKNEIKNLRKNFIKSYKEGDFFSATDNLERLVKLYANKLNTYEQSIDLYNLGILYQKTNKFLMSQKVYKKIIKLIDKKEYDIENKQDINILKLIIDTQNSLGIVYNKSGKAKYKDSLDCFQTSLRLIKKYLPKDIERTLAVLHNIGCLNYDLEKYEDAIYYHLEELSLREDFSKDYIDNLNFLGYDYEAMKDYDTSIGYFKKALEIIKGMEGINSESYMNNIYYLSLIYLKAQDYKNAIKYLKDACLCIEQKLGEKHQLFAKAINNLASCYVVEDKLSEALNLQLKSNKITEDNLGKNNNIYLTSIRKIGDIYYIKNQYEKALQYYLEEINIRKDLTNETNPDYIEGTLNLINVYLKLDNKKEVQILEKFILNLKNAAISKDLYKSSLLILAKIYIENNNAKGLYSIYEEFRFIITSASFDEMLEMAKAKEETILSKKQNFLYKDFKQKNIEKEKSDSPIPEDFKNFLEELKKELEDIDFSNKNENVYEEDEDNYEDDYENDYEDDYDYGYEDTEDDEYNNNDDNDEDDEDDNLSKK